MNLIDRLRHSYDKRELPTWGDINDAAVALAAWQSAAPEFWADCPECCGEGGIEEPRPQHDDPYFAVVIKCEACNGAGGFIREAEGVAA